MSRSCGVEEHVAPAEAKAEPSDPTSGPGLEVTVFLAEESLQIALFTNYHTPLDHRQDQGQREKRPGCVAQQGGAVDQGECQVPGVAAQPIRTAVTRAVVGSYGGKGVSARRNEDIHQ